MRKKVKYYHGYEITKDVIDKINLISLKRFREGRYGILYEESNSLEELCYWNDSHPTKINVILGEDWYIVYSKTKNYIEINEWVSIETVANKLEQTMEMFNCLKEILLLSEGKDLIATMKHNTSYKFYYSFLERGYLQELSDDICVVEGIPNDLEMLLEQLGNSEEALTRFFKDENRDKNIEEKLEDYIYHDAIFCITDKFKNRYKK